MNECLAHIDAYRPTTPYSANLREHLIPLTGVNTATAHSKTISPLLPRVTIQDVRII